MVVTFRTPENKFAQMLRKYPLLENRWQSLRSSYVRWFSPGVNLGGAQIVGEIWRTIVAARRGGAPIERIIFEGIEVAETQLPQLRTDELFWQTLHELITTQALTGIFVGTSSESETGAIGLLQSSIDYSIKVWRDPEDQKRSLAVVTRTPDLSIGEPSEQASFRVQKDGEIVVPDEVTE